MHDDPLLLRSKNAAELYLIRHGDALPGAEEIIPSGIYDDLPLSAEGRKQSQKLAERLRHTAFAAAYSSPLRRCRETAAPLLTYLDLTPTIVEGIREISTRDMLPPSLAETAAQDLEGLARALQTQQMEIVRAAGNSGHWDDVALNESSKDFRRRIVRALDEIAHKHVGERVLIFTHGGVINAYAADVLGIERDFFFPCANTSINVVRANTEQRVLFVLNDIAHILS